MPTHVVFLLNNLQSPTKKKEGTQNNKTSRCVSLESETKTKEGTKPSE